MPIITLTTDFGLKDYFAGAVKGSIYSELNQASIVDISHLVSPYDVAEGAYIIRNAYRSFPKGSIHIIGIDSELTPEKKHLTVFLDGHYFICADNGIISLIAHEIRPEKIVEITIHDRVESHFTVLGAFVKVACHLARGGSMDVIGKTIDKIKINKHIAPSVSEKNVLISGHVLYIDNYGNVVTNITKKLFKKVCKNRSFVISARSTRFTQIHNQYSDVVNFSVSPEKRDTDGNKLALWNASGYLELAIYKSDRKNVGGANSLLGMKAQDPVTITFN